MIRQLSKWLSAKPKAAQVDKKKLFVHAGSYKTGTTYFQHTLYENSDRLEQSGLLYPKNGLGLSTNHNRYAHRILGIDIASGRKNRFPDIIEHLNQHSHLTAALISYEGFGHPKVINKLQEQRSCFEGVHLHGILVFRPHIDFAISLYREVCQHLSFRGNLGNLAQRPEGPAEHHWNQTLNYRAIIKSWQQLTGKESLHVRSYRQTKANLANELLSITNQQCPIIQPTQLRQNNTLSAPTAELMRRMNKHAFRTEARHQIANELHELDARFPEFAEYCEVTKDQAIIWEKRFAHDRRFLKRYGFDPADDLLIGDAWNWGEKTDMHKVLLDAHDALVAQLQHKDKQELADLVSSAFTPPQR